MVESAEVKRISVFYFGKKSMPLIIIRDTKAFHPVCSKECSYLSLAPSLVYFSYFL